MKLIWYSHKLWNMNNFLDIRIDFCGIVDIFLFVILENKTETLLLQKWESHTKNVRSFFKSFEIFQFSYFFRHFVKIGQSWSYKTINPSFLCMQQNNIPNLKPFHVKLSCFRPRHGSDELFCEISKPYSSLANLNELFIGFTEQFVASILDFRPNFPPASSNHLEYSCLVGIYLCLPDYLPATLQGKRFT